MIKKPIFTKLALGISSTLATVYLGISAFAAHTLSIPKRAFNPAAVSAFSRPPIDVEFTTSDGVKISGWFERSPISNNANNSKALILVHGMNSSRTKEFGGKFPEFAAAMVKRGFNVLLIDLRGHGKSADARFTFGLAEKNDVLGAVNWLKNQGFKSKQIGILGVSMGGASAIAAVVDESEIGALVVDCTFAEVYPLIQREWQSASGLPDLFLPSTMIFAHLFTGYDLTSSKPVEQIKRISARPVLIIHSAIETYIPVSNAYALKAADPNAEFWQTTAKLHARNYNADPQAYVNQVTNFFNRSLK
ncbi:X-Pro dipeptidyl-peptidase (S15 family) [Synechococcus sp. PCC 7502]|uniref:alpha/beta hydrolase n=1 Tax=Synechococcus sp. PCC 7502 TaxID=1173263 RepID=UPI00029F946F|nr:alpha/beta fold hydrolase [Synechococcus sp. PCC 7502]AFY74480.1 X-Pro dipeptidyl-peptidase (S15 family) [Synechococcus sp. PCC 7502]